MQLRLHPIIDEYEAEYNQLLSMQILHLPYTIHEYDEKYKKLQLMPIFHLYPCMIISHPIFPQSMKYCTPAIC